MATSYPKLDLPAEIRPIPDYPGYYAGSDGHVYSAHGMGGAAHICADTPRRRLKPIPYRNRYIGYSLPSPRDGKYRRVLGHPLIAAAFHGPRPDGCECSHLNGNRQDNRPENLVWETRKQNHARKLEHGTHDRGCNNSRAKLNREQAATVKRLLREGNLTHKQIGEMFGLSEFLVQQINVGRRYVHE